MVPLAIIIAASFTGDPFSSFRGFSIDSYVRFFSTDTYLRALYNSILIGALSSTLATIVGLFMAFITLKTDLPLRRVLKYLIFVSYIMPPYIQAMALIFLRALLTGYLTASLNF